MKKRRDVTDPQASRDDVRLPTSDLPDITDSLYGDLLAAASRLTARNPHQTWSATDLVHEAWMKIENSVGASWSGRTHFLCFACKAMRCIAIDAAKRKRAQKRGGGGFRVPLDGVCIPREQQQIDVIALEEAMKTLYEQDAELAQIAELRIFGNLTFPLIADAIGRSKSSAERGWRTARARLQILLRGEYDGRR